MYMQSSVGAVEIRGGNDSGISVVRLSDSEYERREYERRQYEQHMSNLINSLTIDINTFFSLESLMVRRAIEESLKEVEKPKISLESFQRLEKCKDISNCSICFENMKDNIKLNCNHIYCENCIKKWLTERSNTCPTCRIEINI